MVPHPIAMHAWAFVRRVLQGAEFTVGLVRTGTKSGWKNRHEREREREMPDRDPSAAAPEPKRPRVAIESQPPNAHPDFPDGIFDDDVP